MVAKIHSMVELCEMFLKALACMQMCKFLFCGSSLLLLSLGGGGGGEGIMRLVHTNKPHINSCLFAFLGRGNDLVYINYVHFQKMIQFKLKTQK